MSAKLRLPLSILLTCLVGGAALALPSQAALTATILVDNSVAGSTSVLVGFPGTTFNVLATVPNSAFNQKANFTISLSTGYAAVPLGYVTTPMDFHAAAADLSGNPLQSGATINYLLKYDPALDTGANPAKFEIVPQGLLPDHTSIVNGGSTTVSNSFLILGDFHLVEFATVAESVGAGVVLLPANDAFTLKAFPFSGATWKAVAQVSASAFSQSVNLTLTPLTSGFSSMGSASLIPTSVGFRVQALDQSGSPVQPLAPITLGFEFSDPNAAPFNQSNLDVVFDSGTAGWTRPVFTAWYQQYSGGYYPTNGSVLADFRTCGVFQAVVSTTGYVSLPTASNNTGLFSSISNDLSLSVRLPGQIPGAYRMIIQQSHSVPQSLSGSKVAPIGFSVQILDINDQPVISTVPIFFSLGYPAQSAGVLDEGRFQIYLDSGPAGWIAPSMKSVDVFDHLQSSHTLNAIFSSVGQFQVIQSTLAVQIADFSWFYNWAHLPLKSTSSVAFVGPPLIDIYGPFGLNTTFTMRELDRFPSSSQGRLCASGCPTIAVTGTGLGFDNSAVDSSYNSVQPGQPIKYALHYSSVDVGGYGPGGLWLMRYDSATGQWLADGESSLDPVNHIAYLTSPVLSTFQLMRTPAPPPSIVYASSDTVLSVALASGTAKVTIPTGSFAADTEVVLAPVLSFSPNAPGQATGLGFSLTGPGPLLKKLSVAFQYPPGIEAALLPAAFDVAFDSGPLGWALPSSGTSVNAVGRCAAASFQSLGTYQLIESTNGAVSQIIDPTVAGSTTVATRPLPGSALRVNATLPQNVFGQAATFTLGVLTQFPGSSQGKACSSGCPSQKVLGTGLGFTATAYDSSGSRLQPGSAISYALSYSSGSLKDFDLRKLVLMRYDDASAQWLADGAASLDLANGVAALSCAHLSTFQLMQTAVLAAPNGAPVTPYAFPSPFSPSLGVSVMQFVNLDADESFRIYSLAGQFLRELTANSGGAVSWDIADDAGHKAPAGTYIVVTRRKKFKVMVLP